MNQTSTYSMVKQHKLFLIYKDPSPSNLKTHSIEVQIGNIKIKNYQGFFTIQDLKLGEKKYGYEEGFFKTLKEYGISKKKYLEFVGTELERLQLLAL